MSKNALIKDETYELLDQSTSKSTYTAEEKIQAVAEWMVVGSLNKTSKKLGIPLTTIRGWAKSDWWKPVLNDIRASKQDQLDAVLTGIIMEGVQQLADRVQNGNHQLNPNTGELVRVPLKASELAKDAIGIPFDKRALLRGDPTQHTRKTDTLETLKHIADQFVKIAKQGKSERLVEAEVLEIVKDE